VNSKKKKVRKTEREREKKDLFCSFFTYRRGVEAVDQKVQEEK
jgi:hypothetical protein